MKEAMPVTLNIRFPINKQHFDYIFARKAIENALKEARDIPIVEYKNPKRVVGIVDRCRFDGVIITVNGTAFEEFTIGITALEYAYENNILKFISFGVIPKKSMGIWQM